MRTHRPSLAGTTLNRLAGQYLREKRLRLAMTQPAFAGELTELLEGREVSPTALNHYEHGRHGVPAAVLLAAQVLKKNRRRRTNAPPSPPSVPRLPGR